MEAICKPFCPKDYGCSLDFYDDCYVRIHQGQSVYKLKRYISHSLSSSGSSSFSSICRSNSKNQELIQELSHGLFLLVQQYIFNLPLATEIGRYVDINIQDSDGNTLLHLARTSAAIEFLFNSSISPNVRNKRNQTALDTADCLCNLTTLFSCGCKTSQQLEDYYVDKIIDAFLYERMDKLERYLPKLLPETINSRYLLNQCCEIDTDTRFDMASLLLKYGADPDVFVVDRNELNCLSIVLTQEFDPQLANLLFLHSKKGLHQSISDKINITKPEAIAWLISMGLSK